jgi:hypothetical protein
MSSIVGTVNGTQDGKAIPDLPLLVTAGAVTMVLRADGSYHALPSGVAPVTVVTRADGSYDVAVPAGPVSIALADMVFTATATAGQETRLDISVPRTGLALQLTSAKGAPAIQRLFARYLDASQAWSITPGVAQGKDYYAFPGIPDTAREVEVYGRIAGFGESLRIADSLALRWRFARDASFRVLTAQIKLPAAQTLTVVDADGQPLVNTRLHGHIAGNAVTWAEQPSVTRAYTYPDEFTTDVQGKLDFVRQHRTLAPGTYLCALASASQEGAVVALTVEADGTLSQDRYTLADTPRDVTQTVYGYDGAPAAHARVFASYCTYDTAHLLDGMCDATGTVVWKGLPHVRVIVWGDQVPVAVIPPDADSRTPSLPRSMPTREMDYAVTLRPANPIAAVEPMRWWSTRIRQYGQEDSRSAGSYDPLVKEAALNCFPAPLANGETVSVVLVSNGAVPRLGYLDNVFVPYNEYGRAITIPVTFAPLLQAHGALVDAQGAPAPGVSRLRVLPDDPRALPRLLLRPEVRALGLLQATLADAGHFTVTLPQPGGYRLLVDLFDEHVPTPSALHFAVTPEQSRPTITLPPPLFSAPGGSEVRYLIRNAPATTRVLTVAARGDAVAVYGPRADLLQLTCRPAPNVLLSWDAARQTITTLALQHTTLSLRTDAGTPAYGRITLEPLLPSRGNSNSPGAESDAQPLNGPQQALDLWPGVYYTRQTISGTTDTALVPFTVPAASNTPVIVPVLHDAEANICGPRYRTLNLTFPKGFAPGDAAPADAPRSSYFAVRYDAASDGQYNQPGSVSASTSISPVPMRATKMSLRWLGVGSLDDVPLPAPEEDLRSHWLKPTTLTLPAWQPGVSVRGRILTVEGAPWARGRLRGSLGNQMSNSALTVQTDAEGRFEVHGVPVGNLFFFAETSLNQKGAWALDVPKMGLDGLTLRMSELGDGNVPSFSIKAQMASWDARQQMMWWIPDGGVAHALPTDQIWTLCADTRFAGTGWLWDIDNDAGKAQCIATRLALGAGLVDYTQRANDGGPLGIVVTGDFRQGLPGTVTLLGRNALAPIRVDFPRPQWRALSALGAVAMQIDSVPPGDYTVIVNTPDGALQQPVTVTEVGGGVTIIMPTPRSPR